MTTTIVCEKLCKSYAGTQALRDVDLHLPAGRIVGLLGPNGSGKTTLIKILAGLLCPTSGQATICGEPIGVSTKARVSYLPDKMYYAGWMRASDLMELFSDFYADFRRDRAEAMCRALGIDLSAKVKSMSKGTKEKLQLILVMCRQASVYLLDEPIAGVDPAARDYILNTILTNYNENSTVLISTHLISDIEKVLDEVLFLNKGQLVLQKTVDDIRAEYGKSVDALFREVFAC